jgi:hypothetical protein
MRGWLTRIPIDPVTVHTLRLRTSVDFIAEARGTAALRVVHVDVTNCRSGLGLANVVRLKG